jgi:hypothetical protein
MSFSLFKQKGARTPEEVVRHTKGALLAWAELQEHPPDAEVKALEKVGRQRSMWIDSPPFRSPEHLVQQSLPFVESIRLQTPLQLLRWSGSSYGTWWVKFSWFVES